MATSAPSRANANATARPIPESPPVMSAVLPLKRPLGAFTVIWAHIHLASQPRWGDLGAMDIGGVGTLWVIGHPLVVPRACKDEQRGTLPM